MPRKALFFGKLIRTTDKIILEFDSKAQIPALAWEILSDKAYGEINVRMTIVEDDKGRDSSDLAYYWSVVIPLISKGANDMGNRWSNDEAHEAMKKMFLKPDAKGTYSTGKLSTKDFKEYIDKCCIFASEFFGTTVPAKAPNKRFPSQET